jgi:hypothetical protein
VYGVRKLTHTHTHTHTHNILSSFMPADWALKTH